MTIRRYVPSSAAATAVDCVLASGLIIVDVIVRLMPHPPNFVSIAASALFAGAIIRSWPLAFLVPVVAMALSDCALGFYDWHIMIVVYAALSIPAAFGLLARKSAAPVVIFPLAAFSSVIFFITTNFAVWAFSGMYAHNGGGLLECYIAALPFFQNTLTGDLFWTAALFGAFWVWRLVLGTSIRHSYGSAFDLRAT